MTLLPLLAVNAVDFEVAHDSYWLGGQWSLVTEMGGNLPNHLSNAHFADTDPAPLQITMGETPERKVYHQLPTEILYSSSLEGEDPDVSKLVSDDRREANDSASFWQQAKSTKWRFAGATAAITVTGFANWDWGSSSFRFDSEGWFGKDTASLGMDKLGHAYTSYVLTEFFTDGVRKGPTESRSYTAAALAMGLMTYIEIFDGFSAQHGFSHEDLVADAAGVALSVARRTIPGLREKVDFRLLYMPSRSTWRAFSCLPRPHCDRGGVAVRSPITDYSGQRYLLALKLAGIEGLQRTPLQLVELHAGYFARGFTKEEEDRGDPLRRRLFFGVGLNVGELLFPNRPRAGSRRAAKSLLEYLQLPYTAVHSE